MSYIRQFIGWFKVRFIFSDQQLMDAVEMVDRVDPEILKDDALWKQAQGARIYIIKELIRRGHYEYLK
jgi:hypothetical protein